MACCFNATGINLSPQTQKEKEYPFISLKATELDSSHRREIPSQSFLRLLFCGKSFLNKSRVSEDQKVQAFL